MTYGGVEEGGHPPAPPPGLIQDAEREQEREGGREERGREGRETCRFSLHHYSYYYHHYQTAACD
jgi:hypothetical protein